MRFTERHPMNEQQSLTFAPEDETVISVRKAALQDLICQKGLKGQPSAYNPLSNHCKL